ncbi:MAG: hypothetical protein PVF16_03225 [Chromatiales bacterium]
MLYLLSYTGGKLVVRRHLRCMHADRYEGAYFANFQGHTQYPAA